MKILLYTESRKLLRHSGLGRAIEHQERALRENGVPFTTSPKEDYDLLHVNFYGPKTFFLVKKARRKGKKVVYHAHSTEEDFRNSYRCSNALAPLFKWWICRCYRMGDAIVTPTPYSKRLLEGYGLTNVHAISNGVDTAFFQRDEEAGSAWREKLCLAPTDKVVLGIGLYLERKGILDFVEMARRMPDVKFVWLGHLNLSLVPDKIRRAVTCGLPNLLFPGYVPAEEVRAAMSGCDLYWFPTLEENEGIPALEACACKTPLLVRDIPVFSEWLTDGETCFKAKDVDGFEEKIRAVLSGSAPDLTEAAYQVALSHDVAPVGRELIKVYRSLLGE